MGLLCFRLIASNGRRCKLPPDHAGACVGYYAEITPEPSVEVRVTETPETVQKPASSDSTGDRLTEDQLGWLRAEVRGAREQS